SRFKARLGSRGRTAAADTTSQLAIWHYPARTRSWYGTDAPAEEPSTTPAACSKPPGELTLGGVVGDVAGDLPHVRHAERGVAPDREIDPYFGQQAVARNRNAGDHERRRRGKLERK